MLICVIVQCVAGPRSEGGAGPKAAPCPTIPSRNAIGETIMNDTATQANQAAMRAALATGQKAEVSGRLKDILCLEDFEEPARRHLPRPIFGYISGGVESNASLNGNRAAFDEYHFMPRVLVNTRTRTQKTTLLGRTYDLPFGFPPMGGTALAAFEGDLVLAKVASGLNIPYDPERRVADEARKVETGRAHGVVPGVSAGRRGHHHPARRSCAGRGIRYARAHGRRAGRGQSREQREKRLQLAAETDAAACVGLHDPPGLDFGTFPAHGHEARHAAPREHGLRAHSDLSATSSARALSRRLVLGASRAHATIWKGKLVIKGVLATRGRAHCAGERRRWNPRFEPRRTPARRHGRVVARAARVRSPKRETWPS